MTGYTFSRQGQGSQEEYQALNDMESELNRLTSIVQEQGAMIELLGSTLKDVLWALKLLPAAEELAGFKGEHDG